MQSPSQLQAHGFVLAPAPPLGYRDYQNADIVQHGASAGLNWTKETVGRWLAKAALRVLGTNMHIMVQQKRIGSRENSVCGWVLTTRLHQVCYLLTTRSHPLTPGIC